MSMAGLPTGEFRWTWSAMAGRPVCSMRSSSGRRCSCRRWRLGSRASCPSWTTRYSRRG